MLGAMLLSPAAIGAVSEHLRPDDFYRPAHGVIYRAALDMYARGEPVDVVTLFDELEKRGNVEAAGGKTRLAELAGTVPTTANAAHYARIVVEMARRRGLIAAGMEVTKLGWEGLGEVDELQERAEARIFDLSRARQSGRSRPIADSLKDTYARLLARYEAGGDLTGVASGFPSLDGLTAGFQPGDLVILAARPSMGKSALAHQFAIRVASRGVHVALFSPEMSEEQINLRLLALGSRVGGQKLKTGRMSAPELQAVDRAVEQIQHANLTLNDLTAVSIVGLRSETRRLHMRQPLALVIVDYIQLMAGDGQAENRTQEVSKITRALKLLARELEVPVLALSQLNRNVELRHDKRPMLSDLRESGSVEQDADLVLFIYRDAYYNAQTEAGNTAELIIAKHRNGPTDTVRLAFNNELARFTELAPRALQEAA